MKKLFRPILAILFNFATVLFTVISVIGFFVCGGEGNMEVPGAVCFRYFTVDSNLLAALGCLILLPLQIRQLCGQKSHPLPHWAVLLKFAGTVAVFITFAVVMVYLGPVMGYDLMLEGNNLYMHLTTPLLCLMSCIALDGGEAFPLRQSPVGIIPPFLYGTLYWVLVVPLDIWPDFYQFNVGGHWYITVVICFPLFLGLCFGIAALRNLCCKQIRRCA